MLVKLHVNQNTYQYEYHSRDHQRRTRGASWDMCVFQISWCLVFPKIASALIPDLHFEILFWRETWGLESKSFPPPLPLVWPAGHSVRDCILTQYLPVYVCTTHIAHVLLPVNWVYLSMTDKIARCRHTYLCLQEEVENVARMNEFMHDHCT